MALTYVPARHDPWLARNGATVRINGMACTLRVSAYDAVYPIRERVVSISATPTPQARRTRAYRESRERLGDDWVYSLDSISDWDMRADVARQLGIEGAG